MRTAPTIRAYALLSGGKDSVTLAHWLSAHGMLAGCVAIETGISVPEWKQFVRDLCASRDWPLEFVGSSVTYEWLVLRFGFPGPGMHGTFMNWLKGRGIRAFAKRNPGALLASGVRRGESRRRFGTVREWNVMEGMVIWAPLIEWTTGETWAYMRAHDLPRSPVYATLGVSGDCMCGAFAEKNERAAIGECHPSLDARLCALERDVRGRWGEGKASRGRTTKVEQLICVECDPSGRPDSGTRGVGASAREAPSAAPRRASGTGDR